ncbi:MAG: acyltransferase [Lachnospiraceae bacterium]
MESCGPDRKFRVGGTGTNCRSWLFPAVLLPVFPEFFLGKLTGKWKSRIFSVLIPYVVWNLIYYLGYMAASRLLAMQSVVGRDVIPFTVQEIWRAVSQYAYAPIFWYLYQLIFLIIASPVIYALVKNRAVGLFWIIALVFAVHLHLDMRHPNTDALLYYSVAAYFAVHRRGLVERSMEEEAAGWKADHGTKEKKAAPEDKDGNAASVIPNHVRRRCFAEGLAGVVISVFCYRRMMAPEAAVLWTCFYRMAVPMTCWAFACGVRLPKVRPWMRQSMFLYAIHFIVVRFVNKGTAVVTRSLAGTTTAARNLPGRVFPASGNRSYCLLHPCKIPRSLPAGGVESTVGRAKVGRIGGIRTAENPLLSAYRMNSST